MLILENPCMNPLLVPARVVSLILCLACLCPVWLSAQTAAPAAAAPSVEQRLASLEAYLSNGDPSAALKDSGGRIPAGLTTPSVGVPGPGHNTWMMVSAALVLFMTLPGLGLFYGGLVRTKNALSVMAWCFGITSLVTVLWWAVGYSLVFGKNFGSPFLGGTEYFFLRGVGSTPNPDYSFWVSHNVFATYQLAFAIITPAVLIGSVVERMKFSSVLVVATLWLLFVYCPLAHMVWGVNGYMNGVWNAGASIKAIDFAGGMVVEMASGFSALILCLFVGPRLGHGKTPMPPHSLVLSVVGTGMLWIGWYGFNAGSAVAADGVAANAFMTTTLAALRAELLPEIFGRGRGWHLGGVRISGARQGERAGLLLGCGGGVGDDYPGVWIRGRHGRNGHRRAGRGDPVLCLHQGEGLVWIRRCPGCAGRARGRRDRRAVDHGIFRHGERESESQHEPRRVARKIPVGGAGEGHRCHAPDGGYRYSADCPGGEAGVWSAADD